MKCRLIQILAVAMLLGQTVSMLTFEFLPKGFIRMFELAIGEHVLGSANVAESAAITGVIKSIDKLHAELNAIKQQLDTINFEQLDYTNKGQVHVMIEKLFEIREHARKSTYKDNDTLLKKVNKEIDLLITNLQKAKQNIENDMEQYTEYYKPIQTEIFKIFKKSSISSVNIQSIRDTCKKADINVGNIGKHLKPNQMINKLIRAEELLDDKIENKYEIMCKIQVLLWHINRNGYVQKAHDTRDTQSMRNVIGISIAVCAIVTLCIVLLIAVRNKHRTNTGVRLVKWV